MPKRFWKILTAVVLTGALLGVPAFGAIRPRAVRVGTPAPTPPGAKLLGPLAPTKQLQITVALKPRDPSGLAAYALAVSTPGSASYHRYLSTAQFVQRFGPTSSQVAAVKSSLRAHGLEPGSLSANGLALNVHAPSGAVSRAFSTSLERVALPGGRVAFANDSAPLLDASAAPHVQAVLGLENVSRPRPLALKHSGRAGIARAQPRVSGGAQPCPTASTVAPTQGAYTADQIASAYGFSTLYGAGDQGAGQTIALFELEGNFPSDIAAYQQCYGTSAPVSYVTVDGGPPAPSAANQDGLETELDAEAAIGLAPKANVVVYQGPNGGTGLYDTYNRIISDNAAKVISTSWGLCEPDLGSAQASAENTLFQEAAVQGQTVFTAAGDTGSEDCAGDGSSHANALSVDDPASQQFVTSVGGTSLRIGPPRTESVWNDGSGAGGGGISSIWQMPSYQANAPASLHVVNSSSSRVPCGATTGDCREVPDVSSNADTNTSMLVYYNGDGTPSDATAWVGVGGTSAGAPTWAALAALANSSSDCASSPIGFANPALYSAAASAYSSDFNDVISGNNDFTSNNGGQFSAHAGYDMASGLGTPIGGSLAPALCGRVVSLTVPGAQRTVIGTPSHVPVTGHDAHGESLSYSATGLPPGTSIDPSSGVISGTPRQAGVYDVTVSARDTSGSVGTTSFTWAVDHATVLVANPGTQAGPQGAQVYLQISAQDNNGAALTYGASGLPPGLAIDPSSGVIAGAPTAAGTRTVKVYASEPGSPPGLATFTWIVRGQPRTAWAGLAGVGSGKPRLSFRLLAGIDSPAIRSVSISLPRGLRFTANRRGEPKQPIRIAKGVMTISPARPVRTLQLSISSPAIAVSAGIARQVRAHQKPKLPITFILTDANGQKTQLVVRVGAS